MLNNKIKDELSLQRSLGEICEGTPSFDKVEWMGEIFELKTSTLTIRFHYYDRGIRDL